MHSGTLSFPEKRSPHGKLHPTSALTPSKKHDLQWERLGLDQRVRSLAAPKPRSPRHKSQRPLILCAAHLVQPRMTCMVAANDSKVASEAGSNPAGGDVQALAPAKPSSALSSRDLQLQVERYAAQLQAVAKPQDQKAVIEAIMRYETPTPQAVKQYYRSIAARIIDSERALEGTWDNERGRDGMLYGSELARGAGKERGW